MHEKSCPFYTEISGEIKPRTAELEIPWRELSSFEPHKSTHKINTNQPFDLMHLLIEKSYSNFINSRSKDKSMILKLLKMHEKSKEISCNGGTLNNFLFYGVKGHEFARSKLLRMAKGWDKTTIPQVFILDVISHSNNINLEHCQIKLNNDTKKYKSIYGEKIDNTSHLLLSTMLMDDGKDLLHSAFILPIANQTDFLPVSSAITGELIEALKQHYQNSENQWLIIAPLEDKSDTSTPPELIVQTKNNDKRMLLRDLINLNSVETFEQRNHYHAKRSVVIRNQTDIKSYIDNLIR